MKNIVFPVVLLFPALPIILGWVNESNGLMWLGIESIYYYPIYLIAKSLFTELESGLLLPSMYARLLTFIVYLLVLFAILAVWRKLVRKP